MTEQLIKDDYLIQEQGIDDTQQPQDFQPTQVDDQNVDPEKDSALELELMPVHEQEQLPELVHKEEPEPVQEPSQASGSQSMQGEEYRCGTDQKQREAIQSLQEGKQELYLSENGK